MKNNIFVSEDRIRRSLAREERIRLSDRENADQASELNAFLLKIEGAKNNAKKVASEIASVFCAHGSNQAIGELRTFHEANKLTVAEIVMFRSLIQDACKEIVLSDPEGSKITGLSDEELMGFRGYRFYELEADNEWSWAHGSLKNVIYSADIFKSSDEALKGAKAHYETGRALSTINPGKPDQKRTLK